MPKEKQQKVIFEKSEQSAIELCIISILKEISISKEKNNKYNINEILNEVFLFFELEEMGKLPKSHVKYFECISKLLKKYKKDLLYKSIEEHDKFGGETIALIEGSDTTYIIYNKLLNKAKLKTTESKKKTEFYLYINKLRPIERVTYIDKLNKMTIPKLKEHIQDILDISQLKEIEKEIYKGKEETTGKREHKDLYDFETNPKSMTLILQGFLNKVKQIEDSDERYKIYMKYSNTDVEKLLDEGLENKDIKMQYILPGLIKYILLLNKKEQHTFINNLFDEEYEFKEDDSQ